jgi:hypothetical protein
MYKELYYLTESLRDLPAVNFGILAAGIVITSPVLGLRPFLDFLFTTENVPNPTRVTFCPFFRADLIEFRVASRDLDESALLSPVPEEILSISSAFVMDTSPLSFRIDCLIKKNKAEITLSRKKSFCQAKNGKDLMEKLMPGKALLAIVRTQTVR